MRLQRRLDLGHELVVDNFAGGGGASTGIEAGMGRAVDIAINHDPEAVAVHRENHPGTVHYCESVFTVDPVKATGNQPVGLAWFSPDCKHFSKAKGGRPVSKKIRGLAWVVIRWARRVRPRVIMLENVEEFQDWGPVDNEGRPCPVRKGQTFRRFVHELERRGYRVEHRQLRACDYGSPTIRKRLFLIARRDGLPIRWPEPTHGDPRSTEVKAGKRLPWRTAAECIDWSQPCPSIFERQRPLAEATLQRIAKGLQRFVFEAAEPFIIKHRTGSVGSSIHDPIHTVTAGSYIKRPAGAGHAMGICVPYFIPRHGERQGQEPRTRSVERPMPVVTATANGAGLVTAFMEQANTGVVGHDARKPLSTIVGRGTTQRLVTSHLVKLRNNGYGVDLHDPVPTVTAGGQHLGEVRAFLVKYYGTAVGQDLRDPMHTVTAKHRMGLVTVQGEEYQLVDIGMRMLTPRELFRAQGFDDTYRIEIEVAGKRLSKAAQVRLAGNSVCPQVAEALVRANFAHEAAWEEEAAA